MVIVAATRVFTKSIRNNFGWNNLYTLFRCSLDQLKLIIFTDADGVSVFVAAKQLSRRANLSAEEERLFVKNIELFSAEKKKNLVDKVASKVVLS